jgi:hypothetical protein
LGVRVPSLRAGWPDFLCEDYKGIFGVEVKSVWDAVKPNQRQMHCALARAGIPVFILRQPLAAKLEVRNKQHRRLSFLPERLPGLQEHIETALIMERVDPHNAEQYWEHVRHAFELECQAAT